MITNEDLHWLAGLLEGEGCFTLHKSKKRLYPKMQINMNDRDVIERVAELIGKNVGGPYGTGFYTVQIVGRQAIELMEVLKPLMMSRRKARIEEVIEIATNTNKEPFVRSEHMGPNPFVTEGESIA